MILFRQRCSHELFPNLTPLVHQKRLECGCKTDRQSFALVTAFSDFQDLCGSLAEAGTEIGAAVTIYLSLLVNR